MAKAVTAVKAVAAAPAPAVAAPVAAKAAVPAMAGANRVNLKLLHAPRTPIVPTFYRPKHMPQPILSMTKQIPIAPTTVCATL